MPIDLYPNIAKVKRNGAYQNLPGFVQQNGDADIEAMIANKETSTTAQFVHPKDSFFILNDVLYQADNDISVNDIIAVGTNCHVSILGETIYDILNNINNQDDNIDDLNEKVNEIDEKVFGKEDISFTFQRGRYIENGYNMNRVTECVNEGYISAGVYDFPIAPLGFEFSIFYYDTDSQGTQYYAWSETAKSKITIERNAKINFRKENLTQITAEDLAIVNQYKITKYSTAVEQPVFATGIDKTVLTGLYFPNLASGWMVERIRVRSNMYRLGIKLANNTLIINGLDDTGTAYSDTVQEFVNPSTGEILGYYVLHYKGEDYDADDKYPTALASSLDNNNIIAEYLSRKENLVLIGDSIFGYGSSNLLAPILRKLSNKRVFNCGFGGCTMAKTASTSYNPLTFAGIADSIASDDFSDQQGAIGLDNSYPYRYANLAAVDWSKPTTIFVDYINNDFTANIDLGDPWTYTESASDWDVTKFVEAMTYGLNKILTTYPHIRVVFFTSKWRFIANNSNVLVPPYAYENAGSKKVSDYNNALIENANRLGVSVYDFQNWGGSNAFNASYYMIDGKSHFTIEGYKHFAEVLNNLDKSFIG